jgi:OmpA-OmpF porin, OOP family
LTSEGKKTLNILSKEIAEFNTQTVAVRIIGHTSQIGDAALNQNLSQLRAQVVVDYLRSLGLKHKIIAQGKGFSDSLAGVSSADSQNQRTEIRLIRIN